jgi:exopolysaccharide biosynthesis polyprenyl glycosylphosphotransferase
MAATASKNRMHLVPEPTAAAEERAVSDAAFAPDVHDKAGPSKQVAHAEAPDGPVYVTPAELPPYTPVQAAVKRAVDVAVAGGALLAGAPLLATIALAVKLDSRGPVIYRQVRVGKDGAPFDCLKFRSMTTDAEKDGPRWARSFDARVTRVGGILRRTSLDELPQLWNVVKGEMSLVGPRPERPVFVSRFREEFKDYDLRHTIRPGLSGWAQVNGLRGNVSIADRTVYDLYYVRNFSLALDARILVRTVAAVLAGE